ncbi:hypothetical protein ACFPZO_24410 [Microbispora camponoti]|uniref:CpsD/CapB family tyrosine-protein kinase n=1 Tax=Microbispora bryophytorum subsp. camponoti TaxID=1677852 RepID=A0ABR8L819_9ACTN|nr:hypothetical protein [Microbispora camponoti]
MAALLPVRLARAGRRGAGVRRTAAVLLGGGRMALIAVTSPGGAPGVTTVCLAAAFTWPDPVLLAECDPSGGGVLPGYFAGQQPYRIGVAEVAMTAARDLEAARVQLAEEAVPLDGDARRRLLLPGVADPRQALQIKGSWPQIAQVLTTAGRDVIADVGALGVESVPYAILTAADAVVLVLRPTVRFVAMAGPRIEALSRGALAATPHFLLLIGEGPYPAAEVSRTLGGTPILGTVPMLPKAAHILSDGAAGRTRWAGRLQMSSLLRTVGNLGAQLRERLDSASEEQPAAAVGVVPPASFGAGPDLHPGPAAGADSGGGRR